jgi:hypothetical protein
MPYAIYKMNVIVQYISPRPLETGKTHPFVAQNCAIGMYLCEFALLMCDAGRAVTGENRRILTVIDTAHERATAR